MAGLHNKIVLGFPHFSTLTSIAFYGVMLVSVGGCASLFSKNPEDEAEKERLSKLLNVPDPPELIREAAVNQGLHEIRVDGVAVVNQLPGTGGPALPSTSRDMLLEEMKRNEVPDPNKYLERNDNALVQVRGLIPPGARRGDVIDLQVLAPTKTEASNLHGGWLLDTRLRHQQVLQNAVRSSDTMAIATGPVLTRADYDGTDDGSLQVAGRILSGGLIQKDRKLSLILRPDFQHVKMASAIADAINRRFYFFDGSTRRGIAKPIEDDLIEIDVLPRYRGHEERLMAVAGAIRVAPESSGTQAKLVALSSALKDPAKSFDAALQLEAMGETAVPTLLDSLKSTNPEIRFYASETLAYLNRVEAIGPLVDSIRAEPAFRAPGLAALRGMESTDVSDRLLDLLDESSLETRYGAMTSLRERADGKRLLRGENLGGALRFYKLASRGEPAVVVSLKRKPEVVVFGEPGPLNLETFFLGTSGMMIRKHAEDGKTGLRVTRFQPGREDALAEVPSTPEGLIRGIVQVGGNYGDVVATLRMAKEQGVLRTQLAFDPLPTSQRTYYRDDKDGDEDEAVDDSTLASAK